MTARNYSQELCESLIQQQGNTTAAAATLHVNASTFYRWRTGAIALDGAALVAIKAVLAHPEDYTFYKSLVRPAHRPRVA